MSTIDRYSLAVLGLAISAIVLQYFFPEWTFLWLAGMFVASVPFLRSRVVSVGKEAEIVTTPTEAPVFGRKESLPDPYRIVDDTQASLIFNQLADAIIEVMHGSLQARSVFLYLISHDADELVLQSFRSTQHTFRTEERVRADHTMVRSLVHSHSVQIRENISDLFWYTGPVPPGNVLLYPVVKRTSVLGFVGADYADKPNWDAETSRVKPFVDLILHSIQTVDAVFTKNVLKRWMGVLGSFVRQSRPASERVVARRLLEAVREATTLDGIEVWAWTGSGDEAELCASQGNVDAEKNWVVSIQAGGEEWGFLRCFGAGVESLPPIDHEAIKFLASSACLMLEQTRQTSPGPSTVQPVAGYDKRRIDHRLQKEISRTQRFQTQFTLVRWEIRWPREYEGNFVLDKIDEIFRHSIRAVDDVGRMGVQTFVAILVECDHKHAERWVQRTWSQILMQAESDLRKIKAEVDVGYADSRQAHSSDELWEQSARVSRLPWSQGQIQLL